MTASLGVEFPREQARLRIVLGHYKDLGVVGMFGATMIEDCLRRADQAWNDQDVVAMLRLYKEMQSYGD